MVVQLRPHTWSCPASTWRSTGHKPKNVLALAVKSIDNGQSFRWKPAATCAGLASSFKMSWPLSHNSSYEARNPGLMGLESNQAWKQHLWAPLHCLRQTAHPSYPRDPAFKMTKWLKGCLFIAFTLTLNHHCPGEPVSHYQHWLLIREPSCLLWWEHAICLNEIPDSSGSVNQPLIIPINLSDSLAVSLQHPTPLTKLAKRILAVMKCEMF